MRNPAFSRLTLFLAAALTVPAALFADNLAIEVGARHILNGESDIVHARKTDLAIAESAGAFSLGQPLTLGSDPNKFGASAPFFSMIYRKDFGALGLQLGLAYETFSARFSHTAAGLPSMSGNVLTFEGTEVDLKQEERNRDLEVGLRIPVKEGILFLTPRIGTRLSEIEVTGSESSMSQSVSAGLRTFSMGSRGIGIAGDASGMYAGLSLDWTLSKIVDVTASYTWLPGLTGNLDRRPGANAAVGIDIVGPTGASVGYFSQIVPLSWKSGYQIDGSILDVGLKWKIGERFFLKTSYRREDSKVSYPGNAEVAFQSGTLFRSSTDFVDPISNALIYGQPQNRSWAAISLSLGANVDFEDDSN